MRNWFHNLINTLRRRFRWLYLLSGFVALAAAAISWKLETNQSYWIWHRYDVLVTSPFFVCMFIGFCNPNRSMHTNIHIFIHRFFLWQLMAHHNIHVVLFLSMFNCFEEHWWRWTTALRTYTAELRLKTRIKKNIILINGIPCSPWYLSCWAIIKWELIDGTKRNYRCLQCWQAVCWKPVKTVKQKYHKARCRLYIS